MSSLVYAIPPRGLSRRDSSCFYNIILLITTSINDLGIMPAHSVKVPHDYFTTAGLWYRLLLTKDSRGFLFYLSFLSTRNTAIIARYFTNSYSNRRRGRR